MRTITEIYEALKKDFFDCAGAGVTEGGDMSLRLMAVAAEMFSLEAQCEFVKRQAFPQTAAGEYLDMHAATRAISRKAAVKATGKLKFSIAEAAEAELNVPVGTECLNGAGLAFVTTEEGVIVPGELSCEVAAAAALEGENGNTAAGTVLTMRQAPVGVSSVTNPEAFSGGCEAESDSELRERVLASYRKLPNGANAAYYEALALSVPGVEKVVVLPRNRGRGTVDIVFSASDGYPGEELLEKVRALTQECREICVDVSVAAPQTRTVNVTAALTVDPAYDFEFVKASAKAALEAYFGGGKLGESVYAAKILSLLMAVEGVENCALSAPAADIAADKVTLPVLGTVTLSEAV